MQKNQDHMTLLKKYPALTKLAGVVLGGLLFLILLYFLVFYGYWSNCNPVDSCVRVQRTALRIIRDNYIEHHDCRYASSRTLLIPFTGYWMCEFYVDSADALAQITHERHMRRMSYLIPPTDISGRNCPKWWLESSDRMSPSVEYYQSWGGDDWWVDRAALKCNVYHAPR